MVHRGVWRAGPMGPLPVKAPRARNIKRGLSCSREWRILCRFLVDRAPDSIAIGPLCPGTGLIKIVGAPTSLSFSVSLLIFSLSSKLFCLLPLPLCVFSPLSLSVLFSATFLDAASNISSLSLYLAAPSFSLHPLLRSPPRSIAAATRRPHLAT